MRGCEDGRMTLVLVQYIGQRFMWIASSVSRHVDRSFQPGCASSDCQLMAVACIVQRLTCRSLEQSGRPPCPGRAANTVGFLTSPDGISFCRVDRFLTCDYLIWEL